MTPTENQPDDEQPQEKAPPRFVKPSFGPRPGQRPPSRTSRTGIRVDAELVDPDRAPTRPKPPVAPQEPQQPPQAPAPQPAVEPTQTPHPAPPVPSQPPTSGPTQQAAPTTPPLAPQPPQTHESPESPAPPATGGSQYVGISDLFGGTDTSGASADPAAPAEAMAQAAQGTQPWNAADPETTSEEPRRVPSRRSKKTKKPKEGKSRPAKSKRKGRKADPRLQPTEDEPWEKEKVVSPKGEEFFVPVPGGRLSGGRGKSLAFRWTALGIGSFLALASCGVGGMTMVAASRGGDDGALSNDDLAKYHIDSYNTDAGAAYASRYLRLCLWHPTNDDTDASRLQVVAGMNADKDDQSCTFTTPEGSDPNKKRTERSVVDAFYNGYSEPVKGMGDDARYLGMTVLTNDGKTSQYVVPVWFNDPEKGTGPRVVGAIGAMPVTAPGTPKEYSRGDLIDTTLSASLTSEFMPEYMTAWVATSSTLEQFVAKGATPAASTGLGGAFDKVKIVSVTVRPPKSVKQNDSGTKFIYSDGDQVEADVVVLMTSTSSSTAQEASYRLTLEMSADRWFVHDIRGGLVTDISDNAAPPTGATEVDPGSTDGSGN